MTPADQVAACEIELTEQRAALALAVQAVDQALADCKNDPSSAHGKALEKAESARKLASLAVQGASERLEAARAERARVERERALAELAAIEQGSNLDAFEDQIEADVSKALALRSELAAIEQRVTALASEFTNGRRVEVLERARELGTQVPHEYKFEAYTAARLAGKPADDASTRATCTIEHKAPRNVGFDLIQLSARKVAERAAAERKANELEDAQLAKAAERDAELKAAGYYS